VRHLSGSRLRGGADDENHVPLVVLITTPPIILFVVSSAEVVLVDMTGDRVDSILPMLKFREGSIETVKRLSRPEIALQYVDDPHLRFHHPRLAG
jgi:hypothetical protein